MVQGPAFVHTTEESPGAIQGPAFVHGISGIPSQIQGPAFVHTASGLAPLASDGQGEPVQVVTTLPVDDGQGEPIQVVTTLPVVGAQGEPVQHRVESLPTQGQGAPTQSDTEFNPPIGQGPPVQAIPTELVVQGQGAPVAHAITSTPAAVIELIDLVQRDTAQTFLSDILVTAHQEDGDDIDMTIEWRRGTTDPWSVATAQPFDRRHEANPLQGVATASPGTTFNFVWHSFFDMEEGTFFDVYLRVSLSVNPVTVAIAGPFTVSTVTNDDLDPGLTSQLNRRAILSRTPFDFLGNGIVIPFRRGVRDIVSAAGSELIRSSVRQILGTRASVGKLVGELPWRPDFGSKLWVLRHRSNDPTLEGQALAFVREALLWEPRVRVTDVFVEKEPFSEENELRVRVNYTIIDKNVDANNVILPEFEEEVVIGSAVTVQ